MICPTPLRILNVKPTFDNPNRYIDVPCGKCSVCRHNYISDWILRLNREISNSAFSFFVTLTYNDECIPLCDCHGLPVLRPSDVSNFFHRLNYEFGRFGEKLRYFVVGEYGGDSGRPHYHALIFVPKNSNFTFDKYGFQAIIEKLWKFGFVYVGSATGRAASYCCKYLLKELAPHANRCPAVDGYMSCSRRPALGCLNLKDFINQVSIDPTQQFYRNGKFKNRIPRAYRRVLLENLDDVQQILWKYYRRKCAVELSGDSSGSEVDQSERSHDNGTLCDPRYETLRYYRRRNGRNK
ncbi:replication initiator protein [Dipodfec virus UOA04_Rod_1030]|nr:replication initiator protein [Dipodfec virus UOA04_Rod_1030]